LQGNFNREFWFSERSRNAGYLSRVPDIPSYSDLPAIIHTGGLILHHALPVADRELRLKRSLNSSLNFFFLIHCLAYHSEIAPFCSEGSGVRILSFLTSDPASACNLKACYPDPRLTGLVVLLVARHWDHRDRREVGTIGMPKSLRRSLSTSSMVKLGMFMAAHTG